MGSLAQETIPAFLCLTVHISHRLSNTTVKPCGCIYNAERTVTTQLFYARGTHIVVFPGTYNETILVRLRQQFSSQLSWYTSNRPHCPWLDEISFHVFNALSICLRPSKNHTARTSRSDRKSGGGWCDSGSSNRHNRTTTALFWDARVGDGHRHRGHGDCRAGGLITYHSIHGAGGICPNNKVSNFIVRCFEAHREILACLSFIYTNLF